MQAIWDLGSWASNFAPDHIIQNIGIKLNVAAVFRNFHQLFRYNIYKYVISCAVNCSLKQTYPLQPKLSYCVDTYLLWTHSPVELDSAWSRSEVQPGTCPPSGTRARRRGPAPCPTINQIYLTQIHLLPINSLNQN